MLRLKIGFVGGVVSFLVALQASAGGGIITFKDQPAGKHEFTDGSSWVGGSAPGAEDTAYFYPRNNSIVTFAKSVKTSDIRISEAARVEFSISDGANAYNWTVLGSAYPQIGNNPGTAKSPTTPRVKISAGTLNVFGTQFWIGNTTPRSEINSADVVIDNATVRYMGAAEQASWLQIFPSGSVTVQNNGLLEVSLDGSGWKHPTVHSGASLTLGGGRVVITGGKGTLNLDLKGTLLGSGTLDVAGAVSGADTSLISPGTEQSPAGSLVIRTGGLTTKGAMKMELGKDAHDQIILEASGQSAKIASVSFAIIGGKFAPPSKGFIDLVIAEKITCPNLAVDTTALKSALSVAGYAQPVTYRIAKVAAADHDGKYGGFDALRVEFTK